MHVIIVELEMKPEYLDEFVTEIERHIAYTREHEAGCLQLDVAVDKTDPNVFYLYEVYADDDALDEHHHSPSLAQYRETTKEWAVRRSVKTAIRRLPASA